MAVATVSECAFVDTWVEGGALCTLDLDTTEGTAKVAMTLATVKVRTGYPVEV